jgi:hypothetical protein
MIILMLKNRYGFVLPILALLTGACVQKNPVELRLTNLAHLNHLYEEVTIAGHPMAIIHIYSEYPDYKWVDAGNEGIACVDDVARAAVVYLRHFEITGDTTSLRRSRKLIDFCRYMQAEDGLFYNFIFADHSINREGKTSYKSLGWWAARGVWTMGEGYRIFHARDPEYGAQLQHAIQKTFTHLDTLLANYPRVDTLDGFPVPRWLLYNSAADATSGLMLGLAGYAEASNDQQARKYLEKFAGGLIAMQRGGEKQFPYGAFLSWKNIWHGWANGQAQALAWAADLYGEKKFLIAAETEAKFFYPYWLANGWPREIQFVHENGLRAARTDTFAQIAYAVRPMVAGALKLAEITRNKQHAELAGDLATWFFGNNPAAAPLYDPHTGRGYDGILSKTEINRNAGAESTIEALYAILEVEANAAARTRLQAWLEKHHITF